MILGQCVFGSRNTRLKEKLLQDVNITFTGAMDIIRASEVTKTQIDNLSAGKTIDAIENKTRPPKKITNCKLCRYDQLRGRCPAYKKTCKSVVNLITL